MSYQILAPFQVMAALSLFITRRADAFDFNIEVASFSFPHREVSDNTYKPTTTTVIQLK